MSSGQPYLSLFKHFFNVFAQTSFINTTQGCRDTAHANAHVNAYAKSIKVAKDCNFFSLILQVYSTKVLEEIYKRTSCTKILKKKPTVDGGMAFQIPQLFGSTSSTNPVLSRAYFAEHPNRYIFTL